MEPASPRNPLDLSKLSPSEREVLERARSGSTALEVAEQLGLSEATVRTHLSHIYAKLGVRGRVELVARLQGNGASSSAPPIQALATTISPVGLVALIGGCAVAVYGLGWHQAWWTVAFAFGGVAVALLTQGQVAPARSLAVGSAISGSVLLGGMSLFLLFGASFGGGTPWLVASISSIVIAVALLFFARRLLRHRPTR